MADLRLNLNERALREVVNGPEGQRVLSHFATAVQDRARSNARPISSRLASAIYADTPKSDNQGPYVDVGYDKRKPGWVLWFHEVGTRYFPARPHLRPALTQVQD